MPTVDREVHRLHGARHALEILKASGRRPLRELYLRDLHRKTIVSCPTVADNRRDGRQRPTDSL